MVKVEEKPESVLLTIIRSWMDLAASGKLGEACALLDEPTTYGEAWTPERVLALVRETFPPSSRFGRAHPEGPRFSPVAETVGDPAIQFGEFEDGSGFWMDHRIPLNGMFSDLLAQFELRPRGEKFAVILQDLHVL